MGAVCSLLVLYMGYPSHSGWASSKETPSDSGLNEIEAPLPYKRSRGEAVQGHCGSAVLPHTRLFLFFCFSILALALMLKAPSWSKVAAWSLALVCAFQMEEEWQKRRTSHQFALFHEPFQRVPNGFCTCVSLASLSCQSWEQWQVKLGFYY